MSRFHTQAPNENVQIVRGNDHATGRFVQVFDRRYAGSKDDEQGEGYVLDYDQLFKFTTNLIGATVDDLNDNAKLIKLTEAFIKKAGL